VLLEDPACEVFLEVICDLLQLELLALLLQVGYHGQEAVRDGEGHGQDAEVGEMLLLPLG